MYRALRPLTCSMRMLLRPSLDRTRLLFLKVPTPPDMPPPSRGFKTSVCVWEWQTFWGEELREEGGVADVIWRITQNMLGSYRLFTVSFEVTRKSEGGKNENVYCIVFKASRGLVAVCTSSHIWKHLKISFCSNSWGEIRLGIGWNTRAKQQMSRYKTRSRHVK